MRISARVNKNEMFNRLELVANDVSEAKPEEAQQEISSAAAASPEAEAAFVEETDIETNNNGSSN